METVPTPNFQLKAKGRADLDGTHEAVLKTNYPLAFELQERVAQKKLFLRLQVGSKNCGCILAGVEWSPENIVELDRLKLRHLGSRDGSQIGIGGGELPVAQRIELRVPPNFPEIEFQRLRGKPMTWGEKSEIYAFSGTPDGVWVVEVAATEPSGIVEISAETKIDRVVTQTADLAVSYSDIGGLDREIRQVREMVEYPLRFPELFEHMGIPQPRGVILHGPPGTGKTLIAKALACEVGAKVFVISGPELFSKWYGESEQSLRKTFEEANRNAPAVVLIDELDSLAPRRDQTRGDVEPRMVATLLTLMDGLKAIKGVVVVGTTNRLNSIDSALRREGRFATEVNIGVPDTAGRLKILEIQTRRMPRHDDVALPQIAESTVGFVGADLAALCREAAYAAIREVCSDGLTEGRLNADVLHLKVGQKHFLAAQLLVRPSAMREFMVEIPETRWEDIGGLEHVKKLLIENVAYPITKREGFAKAGVKPARGTLLYGPPGTGKTLLARATARECGANFIAITGPELRSKWFGESEEKIRHIFAKAREAAPCVIFIDEIDAAVPARGQESHGDSIVNQVLCEMDGIQSSEGVFVLGATNRPEMLDPALLRSGRFDYQIEVPLPDATTRAAVFRVHLKHKPVANEVNTEALVGLTDGLSCADIAGVCRQAALNALRENQFEPANLVITMRHLNDALQRVRQTAEHLKPKTLGFAAFMDKPETSK